MFTTSRATIDPIDEFSIQKYSTPIYQFYPLDPSGLDSRRSIQVSYDSARYIKGTVRSSYSYIYI